MHWLGSAYLALLLVPAILLCSIVGAVIPQEGITAGSDLEAWRSLHPLLTRMVATWGGFHIFSSGLFLTLLTLLGVNIIACMATHWPGRKGIEKRPQLEVAGFALLHVAVLLVISGGFVSAGWRTDGRILLTEGQSWRDAHDRYLALFEAPFRRCEHQGFEMTIDRIEQRFEGKDHQVELRSHFLLPAAAGATRQQALRVNDPFTFRGLTFTQDQIGFAPRLKIVREADRAPIVDSFLALKRFSTPNGSVHRDVLPMSFAGGTLVVTMFPSATWSNGVARKAGEAPDHPVVKLEYGGPESREPPVFIKLGGEASVAGCRIRFSDWRYWSMYRVSADPGYPLVCAGLWLGLASLVMRYGRLLAAWRLSGAKP